MAKMAYSRLLLWQQRKKQLAEKLIVKRRQEQNIIMARRRSMPALAKNVNVIIFDFLVYRVLLFQKIMNVG